MRESEYDAYQDLAAKAEVNKRPAYKPRYEEDGGLVAGVVDAVDPEARVTA